LIGRYREPVEGTPFGRYQLIELLGRGGMGEVWRAHDTTIDRVVALKMLLPHFAKDPDFDKRFRREARAAARLHRTNIVPVYEVGQDGDVRFYAMQFIDGQGLDDVHHQAASAPGPGPVVVRDQSDHCGPVALALGRALPPRHRHCDPR
jgi:predicted Ser/Thr protein kinase